MRLVWHCVADTVNDFAWATAKKFVWQATRATIPGKGPRADHMVFLPAQRASSRTPARSRATRSSSTRSSGLPYPFPQLTLQDGPSAGMEYPMVINSNQGAATTRRVTSGGRWIGEQQRDVVRLDGRGLQQYMNILSDADAAGASRARRLGQSYGARAARAEAADDVERQLRGPGVLRLPRRTARRRSCSRCSAAIVGDSAVQRAHSA
jgi:hypothetical protein